ncbi:MAG: alkaline phosphatase family protein [Candidatus Nanopelagicales bacterium]|nr:alkaline phosphatase family protein [Candidatus Nanopelagicales bacterium]
MTPPSLAEVGTSAAASVGVPGYTDSLGLGEVQHVVICLIDGLGWRSLIEFGAHAPALIAIGGRPLHSVFPTTTPTALGSLGTGLLPGTHGLVGATFFLPETQSVLAPLRWKTDPLPLMVQPETTVFERVARHGVQMITVAPAKYEFSGLTTAALRGGTYRCAEDIAQRVSGLQAAICGAKKSYTYVYWFELDRIGHKFGVGSTPWVAGLVRANVLVDQLSQQLPPNAAMIVTADHGMINCEVGDHISIEQHQELNSDLKLIAGEPRARHLYTHPGAAETVAHRWSQYLGSRAKVFTRDQIMESGWLGPTDLELVDRIGDVVCIAEGATMLTSLVDAKTSSLIGQHGALTPAELEIPGLIIRT